LTDATTGFDTPLAAKAALKALRIAKGSIAAAVWCSSWVRTS
jgi:hypothetical protein